MLGGDPNALARIVQCVPLQDWANVTFCPVELRDANRNTGGAWTSKEMDVSAFEVLRALSLAALYQHFSSINEKTILK